MQPERSRLPLWAVVLIMAGLALLAFAIFRPRAASAPTSEQKDAVAQLLQGTSTAAQALELAHWIAKEYPAQSN